MHHVQTCIWLVESQMTRDSFLQSITLTIHKAWSGIYKSASSKGRGGCECSSPPHPPPWKNPVDGQSEIRMFLELSRALYLCVCEYSVGASHNRFSMMLLPVGHHSFSFFLQEYMPFPPAEDGEQPKLEFSAVECLLFAFHQLVKGRHADFLTAEEHADRLKDFRQRSVWVQSSFMVHGITIEGHKEWCTPVQSWVNIVHVCSQKA